MWILVYDNEDGQVLLFSQIKYRTKKEAQEIIDIYNRLKDHYGDIVLNLYPLKLI